MDDETPGPRRYAAAFGPDSPVSMPMWKFLAILGAVASGSLTLWQGYAGIGHRFDALDTRMGAIDGKISQSDPSRIRDLCREVFYEEMHKPWLVACPRHVLKGDSVTNCPIVPPKSDR